ncbi:MAG: hypothetical protein J2P54_09945 [Bradyrhizobiaceae bacterium]|nr:hypothetical protein [Bradyrhizobiaceae bacterium]
MIAARMLVVASLIALTVTHAFADDHCLSRAEQRASIYERKLVRLSKAIRAVRVRVAGDVVGARLCEQSGALVYVLTVLRHDGRVARETVDAVNGALVGER